MTQAKQYTYWNKRIGSVTIGILFVCLVGNKVQPASFDCDKVITKVEKLICSNSELSDLDEVLNAAYRRALITSLNENRINKTQKKWLTNRNYCSNKKCLDELYWSRIEWLSTQPRAPMKYKLVMSKDYSVCNQALDSFNKHLNEEYPSQPPAFTPTEYRKHVPTEISPQWRDGPFKGESWITEVDLDWDGTLKTVLKEWSLDRREKKDSGLDVMNGVVTTLHEKFTDRLNYLEKTFSPDTYFLEESYGSGRFGKPQYDRTYIPQAGVTGIEAEQFDILTIKEKAYITFVSNDLGEDFFEDWSERKWRIISQYQIRENRKSVQGKIPLKDELKDICYFVLIRNTIKENNP
jgi:uncharacterized protein